MVDLTIAFEVNIQVQMYCQNIYNKKLLLQLAFQFSLSAQIDLNIFLIFNSMNKNYLPLLLDGHCIYITAMNT